MDHVRNLFAEIPASLPDELFETLLTAPGLRIERIVSHGHASPPDFWYDQSQGEWLLLLSGSARLALADPNQTIDLTPGNTLNIAPHRRHRVDWTSLDQPTIWLAIHYGEVVGSATKEMP